MDAIAEAFAPFLAATYTIAKASLSHASAMWPCLRDAAKQYGAMVCTKLHLLAILLTAFGKVCMDTYFPRRVDPPEWKLRQALVFRDAHDDVQDITSWFVPDEDWKDDVQETFYDWDDWRLELRCTYGPTKCRIIARATDTLPWPPRAPSDGPHIHTVRAPTGILSATLLAKPGTGAKNVDITKRVQKYAGIHDDFHGTCVRVRDMFPIDDHDDNVDRFEGIRIIDIKSDTGLSVRTYSYATNDQVSKTQ